MNKKIKGICYLLCTIYILFLSCGGSHFLYAREPGETPAVSQAPQVVKPKVIEQIANFLYSIYNSLTEGLSFLLEQSIFKEYPKVAEFYGQVASFLISITSLYLILLLVTAAKKVIGVVLILGWILFIVTIVIRAL
ncbi:hypothetical protein J7K28_05815 [Candidatus Aerophobetes bacterium]|nr:hypothetical protein [Candidatus Aerophobetes bacterium]